LGLQGILAHLFAGLLNLADGNHVIRGTGVDSQDLHDGHGDAGGYEAGNRDGNYQLDQGKAPLTFI
jgi:hypothetical protein